MIDALNFRRSADDAATTQTHAYDAPAGGGWDGASLTPGGGQQTLANARDIAQTLGSLQHDATVRAAVEQGNSLREYLANNKQMLARLKTPPA